MKKVVNPFQDDQLRPWFKLIHPGDDCVDIYQFVLIANQDEPRAFRLRQDRNIQPVYRRRYGNQPLNRPARPPNENPPSQSAAPGQRCCAKSRTATASSTSPSPSA